MNKVYQKKILSFTVSALMVGAVCQSLHVNASDIDIYSSSTGGRTSILLMLDTSGSMGISSLVLPKTNLYGSPGDVDTSLCDRVSVAEYLSNRSSTLNFYEWAYNLRDTNTSSPTYNKTAIYKTITIGTTTIPYYIRGCSSGGVTQYDRLSRLKDAILPLLADTSSTGLSNSIVMGLGHFSSKTELTIGTASNRLTDGHSGRILVPNAALTTAQRIKIAQQIAAIKSLDTTTDEDGTTNSNLKLSSNTYPNITKSSGGTPTAHAYAEAGAYMMGTSTGTGGTNSGQVSTIYDGYMVMQNGSDQAYFVCVGLGSGTTSALGATVKQCNNNWPSYDGTNKTVATSTISGGVYKPNGSGGWTKITSQSTFKTESGVTMNNGWETFSKLPVGWRYGGWMKVNNEPMDIEPIVGTVWPGYAGSTNGLVSYRTNPFLVGGTTDSLIGGFAFSTAESKTGNVYTAGGSSSSCDGNGIYFLTDGTPNSTKDTMAQTIMNLTLNNNSAYTFSAKPSGTDVLVSPVLQSGLFTGETGGWEYIGEYSKKLLDRTKNPANMSIKTAVVGFGSSFSGITRTNGAYNCADVQTTNPDAYNACKWGGASFGNGGFYYAENSNDIKNSIINFVQNVTPTFSSVTTGSPTLPQDALNPLRVLPYGYYASFVPTPQDSTQLWVGNLNKYHLMDGQLYNLTKTIKLFNTDGSLNSSAAGIWTGGVKGQLSLGVTADSTLNRTLYTNRQITSGLASQSNTLNKVTFTSDYLTTDPQRNYWLNLLGYNVLPSDTTSLGAYINKTPDLRQLGSTMHSTPVLLTQSGTITSSLDTSTRQDYLMFGTTQGLLHVVDKNGQEVFAFVPNEMMENSSQREAFRVTTASTGGSSNLFYGVDAPWIANTQYVANSDGSLTVGTSDRSTTGNVIKGRQWVYGGLRMGGSSYYSLDLTTITTPSLKFHINPKDTNSEIINASTTTSVAALNHMGQSWSKPTIARVKFGGVSKLVMIVGGGYDSGYESPSYDQINQKGAGVYMFDADNGDLLWWASANATDSTDLKGAQAVTSDTKLKYSVVSQINAIDRDGDGYVDNLYFGDLGGQAFRIDLNNQTSTATQKIDARVARLTNQHASNGASPRFYEMPSVSAQTNTSLGLFLTVALSSGNRSSPLSGVVGSNNATASTSADDGMFVIYDKDVGDVNLYSTSYTLKSEDVSLVSLNTNYTNGVAVTNGGWVYRYGNGAGVGVWKGLNSVYAVDSILYTNVYHRDGTGIGGSCGAGVKGDSYLYRFCLPTGNCSRFTSSVNTNGTPDRALLGAGIIGAGLGASNTTGSEVKSTITTATDCTQATNKTKIECQSFSNGGTIRTLRWYESNY